MTQIRNIALISHLREIMLSVGLLLVFISFLFHGRQQGAYLLLLVSGLVISFVSYLAVLLSKKSWRAKLIWTAIVLLSAGMEFIVEPLLVKSSYLIYLSSNSDDLNKINEILTTHEGEISIDKDTIISTTAQLDPDELKLLESLREEVDSYFISKSNAGISYGLFGFLDVRLGVSYVIDRDKVAGQVILTHLVDNWYYY